MDDLPEDLLKIMAQECKNSGSGLTALLSNVVCLTPY